MYCLDRETGNQIWRFPSGEPLAASFTTGALLAGNILVAAADDKAIYGINVTTGEMAWQYIARDSVYARPVLAGNTVVFGLSSNMLMALDSQTGTAAWPEPYTPSSTIYDSMVAWQNTVLFFTSDGNLNALDAPTKRPAWRPRLFTSVSPFSSVSIYGDVAYVTSGSYVTSLSASTGRIRWEQIVPGVLRNKAAASSEGVVVTTDDGRMHTFSTAGRPAFRTGIDLGSSAIASPAFTGKMVVIPTANGALNLIDPFSGQIVWNFTVPPMVKGTKITLANPGGGGTGAGGGGRPGTGPGGGGLGGQTGTDNTLEIKSVMAAGSVTSDGNMLVMLAVDGSILAFDRALGVDLTAPEITMGFPNAGDQVSGRAPMELVFLISDAGSGVNYDSVHVTINGQEYIHEIDREGRIRIRILQGGANKPLANGRARIIVAGADWMENTNAANFVLTIDNTLPPLGFPKAPDTEQNSGGSGNGLAGGGGNRGGRGGGG